MHHITLKSLWCIWWLSVASYVRLTPTFITPVSPLAPLQQIRKAPSTLGDYSRQIGDYSRLVWTRLNKSVGSHKLARAKVCCVCGVVSFPKFHYNDLLPTCYGLVGDTANYLDVMSRQFAVSLTSPLTSWQLSRLRGSYVSNGFWALQAGTFCRFSIKSPLKFTCSDVNMFWRYLSLEVQHCVA